MVLMGSSLTLKVLGSFHSTQFHMNLKSHINSVFIIQLT